MDGRNQTGSTENAGGGDYPLAGEIRGFDASHNVFDYKVLRKNFNETPEVNLFRYLFPVTHKEKYS